MSLYITFKNEDRDKLAEIANYMHIGLKGYQPYIDSDVAVLATEDNCGLVLAIGDATTKQDTTLTAKIMDSD